MYKICTKCSIEKSELEFTKVHSYSEKRRSQCKTCTGIEQLAYRRANPEKTNSLTRKWQKGNLEKTIISGIKCVLKRKYNLTLDQYNEMLKNQNGVCAICKIPCKSGKRLAVDHSHISSKVRSLLCIQCNTGLGSFRESVAILDSAKEYLKKYA